MKNCGKNLLCNNYLVPDTLSRSHLREVAKGDDDSTSFDFINSWSSGDWLKAGQPSKPTRNITDLFGAATRLVASSDT